MQGGAAHAAPPVFAFAALRGQIFFRERMRFFAHGPKKRRFLRQKLRSGARRHTISCGGLFCKKFHKFFIFFFLLFLEKYLFPPAAPEKLFAACRNCSKLSFLRTVFSRVLRFAKSIENKFGAGLHIYAYLHKL